jgi:benzoyl-CoA reductase subunit C
MRDQVRVIVVGAFCEQPPLGLIKTIERAGCAIVDDDFLLGNRLIARDVAGVPGDPLAALVDAFLTSALATSILYERDPSAKKRLMQERAVAARADGILFAAASFCDPALLDRPMLRAGADAAGIPSLAFQFAENTAQFQQFREQAGTFADSIRLWGAA